MALTGPELDELTALRKTLLARYPYSKTVTSPTGREHVMEGLNQNVRNWIKLRYDKNQLDRLRVYDRLLDGESYDRTEYTIGAIDHAFVAMQEFGVDPVDNLTLELVLAYKALPNLTFHRASVEQRNVAFELLMQFENPMTIVEVMKTRRMQKIDDVIDFLSAGVSLPIVDGTL